MNVAIKKSVVTGVCKKALQPLMNKLYLLGLTGMNYGNANSLDFESTGEKWVITYLQKINRKTNGFVFFDIGANTGMYSRLFAEVFTAEPIKIYAFEPSKNCFAMLVSHTQGLKNIEYFNFGFGISDEVLKIYSTYPGSGATTLYNAALDSDKVLSEDIQLKTLDWFCKEQSITKIDFMKIDVEGHELAVLLGGINLLKQKKIDAIQFEFGSFHVFSRTFFKDFWDLLSPFYTIYRIISDGIFEIKSYSENLEIFRTSNFLALLK